ncbi:MAG TPA: HNH endonuclease signature motif containing protein [Candidatus Binatia bacterium]|nr:HNH endonuclease signature motif containing protein [Candidatus Binatia bacterium]
MLKVVRRDGQMCQVCKQNVRDDEVEFDHIIPHSKGGPTTTENLRLLCRVCNRKKSDSLRELLADT